MKVTITPQLLHGTVTPPPSKSQAHRCIIAAALAPGTSQIRNIVLSKDMEATLRCIEALGATWSFAQNVLTITGIDPKTIAVPASKEQLPLFDCGESGSTLRFFIPIALAICGGGRFTGRGRLMQRPQKPYFDLFDEKGIFWEQEGDFLTVYGQLKPGTFALAGDVSSQFFTGLLFALSFLEGESKILSTTPLESRDYVELTMQVQKLAGISIRQEPSSFTYPGHMQYHAFETEVEADWSQAAFWYAAQALGSPVTIQGMDEASAQGDKVFLSFLRQMQTPGEKNFDVSDCPDLVPPLAAAAALRGNGEITQITGAARLRIKESDRLATVHDALQKMGASITEHPDSLTITAKTALPGGCSVDAANDHRIAMMAAISATKALAPVVITGAECVAKSYPDFWEQYAALGGNIVKSEEVLP